MLIGGAVSASLVFPRVFPFIMDVALGRNHIGHTKEGSSSSTRRLVIFLVWIIGVAFVAALWLYNERTTLAQFFRRVRGYDRVSMTERVTAAAPSQQTLSSSFKSNGAGEQANENYYQLTHRGSEMMPDSFNMFDPAELPPRLSEYANMVYSACEDLGNFFGFQDSSVRNQAEHLLILLSNHRRYMTVLPLALQPPSPIHALHAKVSQSSCIAIHSFLG